MDHFDIRGVVEGFYGRPWSFQERKRIIDLLGEISCNLYLYAPKNDPFHRSRWREAYSSEFVESFRQLVNAGETAGVDIGFTISPGLSVSYCDRQDTELLLSKLSRFCQIGVKAVGIFFDDIPLKLTNQNDRENFTSLASAQAMLANDVFASLKETVPELKTIICPTVYHGDPNNGYLSELGELLDEEVIVMWTGPEVCSFEIPKDDAKYIYATLKRPILYWDNYPVNDATMVPEMHIGPYVGRDPKIARYAKGILLNPMSQAHASMIPIRAASRFMNNPMEYDPVVAWMTAIAETCPSNSEDLLHFAEYNTQSPLHPLEPKEPRKVVEDFRRLFKQGEWAEAVKKLFDESERISSGASNLRENLPAELTQELSPWLTDYEMLGRILDRTAKLLWKSSALYSEEPLEKDLRQVKSLAGSLEKDLKSAISRRTVTGGMAIQNLASETITRIKGLFTLLEGKCLQEYENERRRN